MASRFLENLLASPYPAVFGNAMTMQEAQAAPAGAGSLDALRQQYERDQAALLDAAKRVGTAQAAPASTKTYNAGQFLRSMPYEQAMKFAEEVILKKNQGTTTTGTQTTAQGSLEEAQKAADRSLNQYLLAQQTAAARPASQQQAVNWGQMAQDAENRMFGQATNAAMNAIANEDARMGTLVAHPLLGGGIHR